MGKFTAKKVIITGGASGIGQATADLFITHDAEVIILDKNKDALLEMQRTRPSLKAAIYADVSDYTTLESVFVQIDKIWSHVDVLINNAGISIRHDTFADISIADWKKVIDTNLSGTFFMSKLAVSRMKEGSVILNMSSVNGLAAFPHYADYNASKAGVVALTKTMAVELAPKKIRVNALCPGAVMTPMQEAEYTKEMFQAVNDNIPLSRHADPSEIANFFSFLASDEASFITGHYYIIDGGEMSRAIL